MRDDPAIPAGGGATGEVPSLPERVAGLAAQRERPAAGHIISPQDLMTAAGLDPGPVA